MRLCTIAGWVSLLLVSAGCTPPSEPADKTVELVLGNTGVFTDGILAGTQQGGFFDISDELPAEDPDSATVVMDPHDITVDVGTSGPAGDPTTSITVLVFVADGSADDPCTTTPSFNLFTINVDSSGATTVTPESATLPSDNLALVATGSFGLCLAVSSDRDVDLTIRAIRFTFTPPGPVAARSCPEVLALPEVQEALAVLDSNGVRFRVPTGNVATDLEGLYTLDQETTFDPDDADVGDTQDGVVTMLDQRPGAIARQGFGGRVDFFLQGDASSIGFCALDRTFDPTCDQTVARLENLTLDPETGNLSGHFVAVAVRRHRFSSPTCGARSDFIYGTLDLTTQGVAVSLVSRVGKISLPEAFSPGLIALTDDGTTGVIADSEQLIAEQFLTTMPFDTSELRFPNTVTGNRIAAIGISRGGGRTALAVDNPPQLVTFALPSGTLIRSAVETPETVFFLGERIDLALNGSLAYIAGTDERYADRVDIVRTDTANLPDVQRRLFTPSGQRPQNVRLSPDGGQLAVLLQGSAPAAEAAQLTFVALDTGAYVTPPIDLVASTGGTALAGELVYSANGERVFLAGLGEVLAVETRSPHDITQIDISVGAGDDPVALALSGDGAILAVAVDDSVGNVDFAVVDTSTLEVLNAQDLPGIGNRGALAVAHFASRRIAMVANLDATVVAVQTESPFLSDEPVLVEDVTGASALGRMVSGGDVVAVTNLDEPAVYLFEPAGQ